jgi:nucleoside phosphorylase
MSQPILIAAAMGIELRGLARLLGKLKRLQGGPLDAREAEFNGECILTVRLGIGRRKASEGVRLAVDAFHPSQILLIGLAGGLRREFSVGDPFVISAACLWPGAAETLALEQALQLEEVYSNASQPPVEFIKKGRRIRRARLITVDSFVGSTQEKRKLGTAGFDLVDMEFAAVAETSAALGLPLTGLKVVSDTLAHNFPRYRFSAEGESRLLPPPRLAANSLRACRALGRFAATWLKAAI